MQLVGGNTELDVYARCKLDVGHKKIKRSSFQKISNTKFESDRFMACICNKSDV